MIMYLQWAYIYLSVISLRAILRNMGRFHSFDHGQLTWTFKIQNKLIVRLCKIKISHQSTKIIHHTLDISVYKYFLVKKSLIQMSYVGYTKIRYNSRGLLISFKRRNIKKRVLLARQNRIIYLETLLHRKYMQIPEL